MTHMLTYLFWQKCFRQRYPESWKSIMISMISALDMVEARLYLRFAADLSVYFVIMTSKNLQKSSAIQTNSITLLSVIVAIVVCKTLQFSTIKLQQFLLITNFANIYNSSNSRYFIQFQPNFLKFQENFSDFSLFFITRQAEKHTENEYLCIITSGIRHSHIYQSKQNRL